MRVLRVAHHAVVSEWRQRERELRALGVDVRLVSAQTWNEGGRDVSLTAGDDAFVTGARTVGRHPSVFLFDPLPLWRALGSRPDLIDLHEEPNALATAEVLLLRWLRRSRAPFVLYSAQNIEKRYPPPFRWFERWALHGAAAAYVCNAEAGGILRRKGLSGPAVYVPLGVDVGLFAPAERDVPGQTIAVGYVGRLERHKGVDVLLRAAAERAGWELRITGEGPELENLVRLGHELGIQDRVHFLGYAGGDDLADRYRELDVLAVPSLPWPGWLEQFCRVAVEAMASGVPVVASASGAIPDVVADAGVLVEPGDPLALRAGLDEALRPSTWSALRAAGIRRSRDFTWQQVAADHKAMYDLCLARLDSGRGDDPEVVIVAYGDPSQLEGCLEALGRELPVTIVDNSSSSATLELARRHGARYVDAGANLGFAGGVNLGLRTLAGSGRGGRDVLLLNPDARIDAAGVRRMHAALHERPDVAAIGARQTDPVTGDAVRVWWPFPTPAGAWVEAAGLGRLLSRRRDFVIGSVLMLRAEAVEAVGPFDEWFFLYAEETDWQRRARTLGWDISVVDVDATHEGAGTGGDPTTWERHFYESAQKYVRKHHGRLGLAAYRAANVAGATIRSVLLTGDRAAAARRRRDVFLRRAPAASSRRSTHVVHIICTDAFAGAERYVFNSALSQRDRGMRVTVVGGAESALRAPLESNGVVWLEGGSVARAARSVLRIPDADLLVTHMTEADTVGAAVAALRGIPLVSIRHFAGIRGGSPVARAVSRLVARRVSAQIAISQFVSERIDGESTVVRSGVDDVVGTEERREPFVLMAQRLEDEKATDVALRAWARSTERTSGPWRLVVAGDGARRPELEALTARLGIADSVDFLGFRSDIGDLMRRASILIAPAPLEPMGLSVIEAMAHGLPVVAARGGGHVETVGSVEDAALFEPGDDEDAARLLDLLLADEGERRRYGERLRRAQRERFTTSAQTAGTIAVFERILADTR